MLRTKYGGTASQTTITATTNAACLVTVVHQRSEQWLVSSSSMSEILSSSCRPAGTACLLIVGLDFMHVYK
jgi:hypothetical protein